MVRVVSDVLLINKDYQIQTVSSGFWISLQIAVPVRSSDLCSLLKPYLCDAHTPERITEKNRVVNLWITLWTGRPEWVVKLFCTNLGVINTKARVCPTTGLGNITLLGSWMLPDSGVTREVFCVVLYLYSRYPKFTLQQVTHSQGKSQIFHTATMEKPASEV